MLSGETELCVDIFLRKTKTFYLCFFHVFARLLINSDLPLLIIEEGWAVSCSVVKDEKKMSTCYWVDGTINLERKTDHVLIITKMWAS